MWKCIQTHSEELNSAERQWSKNIASSGINFNLVENVFFQYLKLLEKMGDSKNMSGSEYQGINGENVHILNLIIKQINCLCYFLGYCMH